MESFNFGAFDPTIGARIAAIPQEAQKQQTANMLQAMQMQGAMRQNEMSQMQLDEMKTDRAEMVKLQQDLAAKGGSPDLRQYAGMLMRSPKHMQLGIQLIQKLDQQAQFAEAMRDEPPARTATTPAAAGGAPVGAPAATMRLPYTNGSAPATAIPLPYTSGGAPATTIPLPYTSGGAQGNALAPPVAPPANALAAGNEALAALQQKRNRLRGIDSDVARAALKSIDAEIALASKEPVYHNVTGVGLVDPRTGRVVVPSVESTDPLIKQYEYAKKQGFTGTLFDYKRSLAEAGRTLAAPRPEQPPIAVIDDTGKTVYVSREEALSRRMTPAAAGEGLPPKEIQKRESVYPTATSAVKGFEAKSEAFIKDLKALRNHPGLSSITGIAAGRLPGMTAEGRAAQALYDKVVAKGGFQALQDLRDASKTGGALGNVSNREGQQLTASFAAIDRRQDAPDVQAAIDGAIAGVEGARIRTREAYDDTYSYKSSGGNTPAAPATNIDALLKKYK